MLTLGHMLVHKLYIIVVIAHISLPRIALKNLCRLKYMQFAENTLKNSDIFPKTKGFGCIVAAVLLIFSPKELI